MELSRNAVLVVLCSALVASCSAISARETASGGAVVQTEFVPGDQSLASDTLQSALEKSVSGKTIRWENPDSGSSGSATPLKTWKTAAGTYCRSYREKFKPVSGEAVNRKGVACRSESAVWEPV